MAIIPCVRCRGIAASITFYTTVLDFAVVWSSGDRDPAFAVLRRGDDRLCLSSHAGDGEFGQAIGVLVDDVDAVFRAITSRGLHTAGRPESPVHTAPTDQTWGTREFYVDDPDGNTLRFIQGFEG